MVHLPVLIQDLAAILITAAAVTLICKWLRQPVVLGYLIAGFLVGPHFPFFPTVNEHESIKVWAEIGVIFLLFALGLEFSFKKLAKTGGSATITAFVEILGMLGIGFVTGKALGWSNMDSLFLGGILSISSTTIIVRAFEELQLKGKSFVSLVFGVLIVEDLVAILLLVLLSTVAVTQTLSGTELLLSTVKLLFFLVLWFITGIYILPIFLNRAKSLLNDETTLVVAIGLCLMMVLIATNVGFSPALGAFIMGSILAETRQGKRIEHLLMPVRDLFAAVFFVSVGMLIDPNVLYKYWEIILILTVITIVGKFFSTGLGALISGKSLKTSVQAGLSLAQIGEFSFIIATLGLTLKVTSDFLYPIAVAVSAITTFTTPYQIKSNEFVYSLIEKSLPKKWLQYLKHYETAFAHSSGQGFLGFMWKEYGMKIVLNSNMVVAIGLLGSRVVFPALFPEEKPTWASLMACALTLIVALPFLWAVMVGVGSRLSLQEALRLKRIQVIVSAIRILIGLILVGLLVSQFVTLEIVSGIIFSIFFLIIILIGKNPKSIYQLIEKRFLLNLTDTDRDEYAKALPIPEITPWEATLAEFILSVHSDLVGKTLIESQLKEKFGLTIALIKRGNKVILTPGRNDILMPHDQLYMIGTDDELARAKELIEKTNSDDQIVMPTTFGLESLLIEKHSPFLGRAIRDSGLRDQVGGLIVGIERLNQRFLSPDSSMIIQEGDLVWIVGDVQKIRILKRS